MMNLKNQYVFGRKKKMIVVFGFRKYIHVSVYLLFTYYIELLMRQRLIISVADGRHQAKDF